MTRADAGHDLFSPVCAEGVGFEPTRALAHPSGFQDRRHRPLGEPSLLRIHTGRRPQGSVWSVAGPQARALGHCQRLRSSLSHLAAFQCCAFLPG